MKKIELLAPAGTKEAFIGAINAGANAIFMAGYRFGARAFAENFTENDLIEAINFAHLRNVFVYVVVNTLIFDEEIADLLSYTDMLVANHVDGLIVQDLGVIDLLCKRYPNTPIHASTQTNAHSLEQVRFLKSLGVKRVILARETPIEIIKQIKEQVDIEIEVFIHGALCVSYSGNCLMSSILNNRSGNRGQCSYNCRLPYKLLKEDEVVNDESYLLSAKDLMTIEYLDQLIALGIDSLKIEGRMRKKEYVTQTVLAYREKIDAYYNNQSINEAPLIDLLKRTFNREYTKGYIFHESPKDINNNFRPNHLGIQIGEVLSYEKGSAKIKLNESLKNGDGFRIIGSKNDYGNIVTFMTNTKGEVIKETRQQDTVFLKVKERVEKGAKIHKTLDCDLEKSLEIYQTNNYKISPLIGIAYAYVNKPLKITLADYYGNEITVKSKQVIAAANNYPTSSNDIYQSLNKLGETPYYFDSLNIETDEKCFITVKMLNEMRREAIEELMKQKIGREKPLIIDIPLTSNFNSSDEQKLVAKVRTKDQLDAAYEIGITDIYYEDILKIRKTDYPKANLIKLTKRIRNNKKQVVSEMTVASEYGVFDDNNLNKDLISDEFLNVTNIYTASLLSRNNVQSVTLSSELNQQQVLKFASNYYKQFNQYPNLEYVVYGHKDLMISKYCPVAKTFGFQPNCGLCFKNQYYLEAFNNEKMALLNDGNCNMRIMDSLPISLINNIDELKKAHVNRLRMDFTVETKEETKRVIREFSKAWDSQKYNLILPSRAGNY